VDTAWLTEVPDERRRHEPVVFTYIGRLSIVHKGLDLIVEAFGKAVEAGYGNRFRLILAGTDENGSMEKLRGRAEQLGIQTIEFPGGLWGADKEPLWSESDYFLHMCRFNGFALLAREAVCKGLPMLTTWESDFGDWTNLYDMGMVVQLSAESLAEGIIAAIDADDEAYSAMSRGARAYANATVWSSTAEICVAQYAARQKSQPIATKNPVSSDEPVRNVGSRGDEVTTRLRFRAAPSIADQTVDKDVYRRSISRRRTDH
jgi:glycosyltransferase involved in cell wall biosynthesis